MLLYSSSLRRYEVSPGVRPLRYDTLQSPEVLAYLNSENAYKDAVLAPTQTLQDKLYAEIVGRIKHDDSRPPTLHRGHWYYRRYETGK